MARSRPTRGRTRDFDRLAPGLAASRVAESSPIRRVQPWFTGESMSRWKLRTPAILLITTAAAVTLCAVPLHAAPPNKKKIMTDEPEAADPGAAMPTVNGK